MPDAYGQCSSRARSRDDTTSVAVKGWPSVQVAGRSVYTNPRPSGVAVHAPARPGTTSSGLGANVVRVGYWSCQTSRATALVADAGSSEPMGPITPMVNRTGPAAAIGAAPTSGTRNSAAMMLEAAAIAGATHAATAGAGGRGRSGRTTFRPGIPVTPPPPWVALRRLVQVPDRCAVVGVARGRAHVEQLRRVRARRGRCCRRRARTSCSMS